MEDRLINLEQRVLNQESLHRNVGKDGNITHYWDALPMFITACAIGVIAGYLICNKLSKDSVKLKK